MCGPGEQQEALDLEEPGGLDWGWSSRLSVYTAGSACLVEEATGPRERCRGQPLWKPGVPRLELLRLRGDVMDTLSIHHSARVTNLVGPPCLHRPSLSHCLSVSAARPSLLPAPPDCQDPSL